MVEETGFDDEDKLQSMFNDNPAVIPGEDFDLSDLMVVGRELTVESGFVDLVAVSRSGDIVIVEFKNVGNPEGRRKVIGQVLDYGATLWKTIADYDQFDEDVARAYFRSRYCKEDLLKDSVSLEAAAIKSFEFENISDGDEDDEGEQDELSAFKANIERNLQQGSFIYIIVCPQINVIAKQIIEYLSVCSNIRIYGVELEYFKHGNQSIVLPRGVAYHKAAKEGKSTVSSYRKISPEDFETKIRAKGEAYWEAVSDLRKQLKSLGGHLKPNSTGMGIYVPMNSRSASLGYIDTGDDGVLYGISGRRLDKYVQREHLTTFTEEARADYKRRLKAFPPRFAEPLASPKWSSWLIANVDPELFRQYLDMLVSFAREQLRAGAEPGEKA